MLETVHSPYWGPVDFKGLVTSILLYSEVQNQFFCLADIEMVVALAPVDLLSF